MHILVVFNQDFASISVCDYGKGILAEIKGASTVTTEINYLNFNTLTSARAWGAEVRPISASYSVSCPTGSTILPYIGAGCGNQPCRGIGSKTC